MNTKTLVRIFAVATIFTLGTDAGAAPDVQSRDASDEDRFSELESRFNTLESQVRRLPGTPVSYGGSFESTESESDSPCDCGGGCNARDCPECGCCFVWNEHTWLKVGAGLRTSYSAVEDGAPNGSSGSNNFNIDNADAY